MSEFKWINATLSDYRNGSAISGGLHFNDRHSILPERLIIRALCSKDITIVYEIYCIFFPFETIYNST